MKVKLFTKWKDGEIVCTCPLINKCNKDHGCEELDFILDPYAGIKECMKHSSYERVNGKVHQKR
jgi:hypothetical protein